MWPCADHVLNAPGRVLTACWPCADHVLAGAGGKIAYDTAGGALYDGEDFMKDETTFTKL